MVVSGGSSVLVVVTSEVLYGSRALGRPSQSVVNGTFLSTCLTVRSLTLTISVVYSFSKERDDESYPRKEEKQAKSFSYGPVAGRAVTIERTEVTINRA